MWVKSFHNASSIIAPNFERLSAFLFRNSKGAPERVRGCDPEGGT
jgi:hypothetical protein